MDSDDTSPRTMKERSSYPTNAFQTLVEQNPLLSKRSQLEFRQHTVVRPDIVTLYLGFHGFRNWNRVIRTQVASIMENHYLNIGRVPTQPEFDSLLEHGSRARYHSRIGAVVGLIAGGGWAYRTLREVPWPPRDPSVPRRLSQMISVMTSYPNIRSIITTSVWRFCLAYCVGGGLISALSLITQANNFVSDSRLKEYFDEQRKQNPEDQRKRLVQLAHERSLAHQIREREKGRRSTQATGQPRDDVSGSYEQDSDTAITPPNSYPEYTGSGNSQSSYSSLSTQSDVPVQSTGPLWARGRQVQPTNEQRSGLDFLDDDASPTAPEYRDTNINDTSTSSVWDRIRRENAVGRSPDPQQSATSRPSRQAYSAQNNQATQGDLYGSEQWSEKDQAQAEFDRMVDAERNAGNEKSSWSRGWGS